MAKAIFNVLFGAMVGLANLILLPINTALTTFLPDLSNAITNVTTAITLFLGNGLAYFFNLLPPTSRYFVLFYLTFLVGFYTISYTIHGIIWLIKVIKKLPLA